MPEVEAPRYTIGVFKDVAFAAKGLEALGRHGFPPEAISVISKSSPESAALIQRHLGGAGDARSCSPVGDVLTLGSLLADLNGPHGDLNKTGLGPAFKRVGFQPHDGRIFETLVGKGGVLVAVRSEVRAADALATLHNYGAGNAAIGAWMGRL